MTKGTGAVRGDVREEDGRKGSVMGGGGGRRVRLRVIAGDGVVEAIGSKMMGSGVPTNR